MKSAITALTILVCLTSCAPAGFSQLSCSPVKAYSKAEMKEAADELKDCGAYAPADFCRQIFSMLGDYHVMRTQALACRQAYGSPKL
jgi:hypothetical protein